MYITVRGGTHAGWRTAPPAQSKASWTCPTCHTQLAYWFGNCPFDYTARPDTRRLEA